MLTQNKCVSGVFLLALPKTHVYSVCTQVLLCKDCVAFDACKCQIAMDAQLMQPDLHTLLFCFQYSQLSCITGFSVPCLPADWWQI